MAYTATITKKSVTKVSDVISNITINVSISDGAQEVFNKDYSARYNTNAPDMDATKADLQSDFVDDWNKFIAENTIYNAALFNDTISTLQTAANNYINQ